MSTFRGRASTCWIQAAMCISMFVLLHTPARLAHCLESIPLQNWMMKWFLNSISCISYLGDFKWIGHSPEQAIACLSASFTGTKMECFCASFDHQVRTLFLMQFNSIIIWRDDSPRRELFTGRLIQDRTDSSHSYVEFMQHIQREVNLANKWASSERKCWRDRSYNIVIEIVYI